MVSFIRAICMLCLTITPISGYSLKSFVRPSIIKSTRPAIEETIKGGQLLVECNINGFSVPAIVDTGAQLSIMSESCLKRCRLSRDMDKRYIGKAVGVGQSDIIGRVLNLPIQVGPISFKSGVSVLKDARVDFIIGMDLLDKFESEINVKERYIKWRTQDKEFKIPFTNTPLCDTLETVKQTGDSEFFDKTKIVETSMFSRERTTVTLTADVVSRGIADSVDYDNTDSDEVVSLEGI